MAETRRNETRTTEVISARQTQKASTATSARGDHYKFVSSIANLVIVVALVVFAIYVAYDIMGNQAPSEDSAARDSTDQKQSSRQSTVATAVDPMITEECQKVTEIPSGTTGNFCVSLQAGAPTKKVKPPGNTRVGIYPDAPAKIQFFDWDGKEVGIAQIEKKDDFPCPSGDVASFIVTMKEDANVRVRIGGAPSPGFGKKCTPMAKK